MPQAPRNQRPKPSLPPSPASGRTRGRRGDLIVGALVLANAVDEDRVGLADAPGQGNRDSPSDRMMDYTVRRSPRARRVRVSVDASGEIEVVLPRARRSAPPRGRARAQGWIERRRRTLARAAAEVARPGAPCPTSAATCGSCRSPAASASTAAATSCSCPRATPGRRSSAGTAAGARRARPRGSTRPPPAPARATAGSPSAASARAGRRARAKGTCRSTGGSCSPPRRCSTTSSSTRSAHLEVMDHSPRFWALLESRVPDWREHARWLRRYGATLRL